LLVEDLPERCQCLVFSEHAGVINGNEKGTSDLFLVVFGVPNIYAGATGGCEGLDKNAVGEFIGQ
jgi:hypothetical protein